MKLKIRPTRGEIFKAARRRDGLSQQACAKKMKLHRMTIKYWEDGTPTTPKIDFKPTKGEIYFMIRERMNLKLKEAADLIGISHVTLIKMEKSEGGQRILEDFYSNYIEKNNIKL